MPLTEILAITGLGFGAALGLGALIAPEWASGVVRLKADPAKGGGYSEFRATYGGLLLMVHGAALVIVVITPPAGSTLVVLPIAAGWFGAAIGRAVALVFDRAKLGDTRIIPIWMATEVALGLAIGAPVLQFLG
ncbi:putative membrane protein [Hyphomonas neptunium ATCC 15444]|uniref:DUF4345 domain-containing protein n=2 Tax=Hyphomonas TaxID=85 RepID=A0A059G063_9PROT|nr:MULTISPECIES: hypothetical protein [Hyphomonas]ABI75824.1 putative membrane protein [Hyphomonas neptunium ATCC 15444]KCZ96121.1 hypothetical protein HHI_00540 [Hyphomonas hirschiana VP5]